MGANLTTSGTMRREPVIQVILCNSLNREMMLKTIVFFVKPNICCFIPIDVCQKDPCKKIRGAIADSCKVVDGANFECKCTGSRVWDVVKANCDGFMGKRE